MRVGRRKLGRGLIERALWWIGKHTPSPARQESRTILGCRMMTQAKPERKGFACNFPVTIAHPVRCVLTVRNEKVLLANCSYSDKKNMKRYSLPNTNRPRKLFRRSMRCEPALSPPMPKGCAAVTCGEHATSDWRERAYSISSPPLLSTWYGSRSGSQKRRRANHHRSRSVHHTSLLWRKLLHTFQRLLSIRQQSQCMY